MTNKKIAAAGITAAAIAIPLFVVAPGHASKEKKKPFLGRNIAHRGLFSKDQSIPENSLEAFRLAVENGYGVELDVQLSKDGQVVVFHDDDLLRVCGVDKRVDELNYFELKNLKLCGTEYTIPLFTDVLKVIGGKTPIICELKMGKRNDELCQKTYDIIKRYDGDICIESFNPLIVKWFRKNAKEILRGQLSAPMSSWKSGKWIINFPESNLMFNVLGRPQFIAYEVCEKPPVLKLVHALGAMKVCWTSHDASNENGNDTVIFEHYLPRPYYLD